MSRAIKLDVFSFFEDINNKTDISTINIVVTSKLILEILDLIITNIKKLKVRIIDKIITIFDCFLFSIFYHHIHYTMI